MLVVLTVAGVLVLRVGDTVELAFKNADNSRMIHFVDLHAVTGPGGGAVMTQAPPGQAKAFRFKALNPALYVYHCATPMVANHISSGMYGLILVEPRGGLPPVCATVHEAVGGDPRRFVPRNAPAGPAAVMRSERFNSLPVVTLGSQPFRQDLGHVCHPEA